VHGELGLEVAAIARVGQRGEAETVPLTVSVDVPSPGSSPAPASRSLPPHAEIEIRIETRIGFIVTPM